MLACMDSVFIPMTDGLLFDLVINNITGEKDVQHDQNLPTITQPNLSLISQKQQRGTKIRHQTANLLFFFFSLSRPQTVRESWWWCHFDIVVADIAAVTAVTRHVVVGVCGV